MSDEQLSTVPQMLEESDPGFLTLTMQPDDYYDVLRGVMRHGSQNDTPTIMVSMSLSEMALRNTMEKLEEPMGHVQLIDCMSEMVMSPKTGTSRYVESPRLLEMVLLAIERGIRGSDGPCFIIIDSINSLIMHNSRERTMAFLEVLYNRVNLAGHKLALLHLAKDDDGLSIPNLRLISDRTLVIE